MPTTYKARFEHAPMQVADEIGRISDHVASKRSEILALLQKRCGVEVDEDDVDPLISDITSVLVKFVLTCSALPLRSPNQLRDTIKRFASDPDRFLPSIDTLDPEAHYHLLGAYAGISRENRRAVALYESGQGPAPTPSGIRHAAVKALRKLDRQKVSRRQKERRSNQGRVAEWSCRTVGRNLRASRWKDFAHDR